MVNEMVDVSSKIIAYGYSPKYADLVCAIAPYKSQVNLMFSHGTELSDPQHLLEGTGKKARHVKISCIEVVDNSALRELIKQAEAKMH